MPELTNPRLILLQSETNKTQYFYLVLFDLPTLIDLNGENPSSIVPHLEGTELTYTSLGGYTLPENYNGDTITYILRPFEIISPDESVPNITSICFKAGDSEKKGDTGGIKTKQINIIPSNLVQKTSLDVSTNYVCKDRCFVIQSSSNHSTYFVGCLVDFPSDVIKVPGPKTVNTNELEINHNSGVNPHQTQLIYLNKPCSYNPTTKVAEYVSIYVEDYNTSECKGYFIDELKDLYAHAWHAELCN